MQICSLHVDGLLLQGVLVGHPLQERNQDVEAGRQGARILAQALDDVGALLRHHHRRLDDDENDQRRQHERDKQTYVQPHFSLPWRRRTRSGALLRIAGRPCGRQPLDFQNRALGPHHPRLAAGGDGVRT